MIRLQKTSAFIHRTYQNRMSWLIAFDHACGKKAAYTVFALTADDPVVCGRELPLEDCRRVIEEMEKTAREIENEFEDGFCGDREAVEACVERWIQNKHNGNLRFPKEPVLFKRRSLEIF